jgi:hypothetical protein
MEREFDSTVSWGAIAAGAVIACAVSLLLAALGVGGALGLVSPWYGDSASATTIGWAAGLGLVCMAIVASGLGGYITGRLRQPWTEVHEDERYFRDSAHGLATWAFATLLTAGVLTGAGTHLLAGASAGSIPAAGAGATQAASSQGSPNDIYVDRMLRSNRPNNQPNSQADSRVELTRILAPIGHRGGEVSQEDRTYAAQVVASRTGLSQEEAQRRVDQTIAQAKEAANKARRAAMKTAIWSAVSLLAGALAGAFAAIEGGQLRNTRWYEQSPVVTPRTI